MRNLRVAISGTHSTGKSTLFESLKQYLPNFHFFSSPTRKANELLGFPINDDAGNYDATQLLCLASDLNNLNKTGVNIITDRCLYDTFIYSQYLREEEKLSGFCMEAIHKALKEHMFRYDLIIIPHPDDVELVNDGVRSMDDTFREKIWILFQSVLNLESNKFLVVRGTNEERIQQILDKLASTQYG